MTAPLRILLVDDHPAVRQSLRTAIEAHADLKVVGEATNGHETLALVAFHRPDVLVLDLKLPDANGWVLLDQLKAADNLPPTLVLSACDEQIYARRLLRAGALGYLMKDEPLPRIIEAIRLVRAGRFVASHTVSGQLIHEALNKTEEAATHTNNPHDELSTREMQILSMLGQNWRNKQIAAKLGLNEKTVSTYKARVMEKLGLRSTADLIEWYRTRQQGER